MEINNELIQWYNRYFEIFRDFAPPEMVTRWGYHTGKPNPMASSLESLLVFSELIQDPNAIILNAGAGASSWMLRKMFKNVICTDPDNNYLEVVGRLCEQEGLDGRNFIHDISNVPTQADYCYYDYGNIQRMPCLQHAINITNNQLYVDDADTRDWCVKYRAFVYETARENGLQAIDCPRAIDEYGRWGVILTKNPKTEK